MGSPAVPVERLHQVVDSIRDYMNEKNCNLEAACKAQGVHVSTYYNYRNKLKKEKSQPVTIVHHHKASDDFTAPPKKTKKKSPVGSRCFLIVGSPQDLAQYVKEME